MHKQCLPLLCLPAAADASGFEPHLTHSQVKRCSNQHCLLLLLLLLLLLPAAVDASEFEPYPNQPRYIPGSPITIVALSRLVYRKGIDILALVIPEICHRHPHVNFIIGARSPQLGVAAQEAP
jgi:glycosyltransferase involved in cell wall biosynthesis